MNRLPLSFESEVLSKHNVKWTKGMSIHEQYWKVYSHDEDNHLYQMVDEYSIAAYALEAILKLKDDEWLFWFTNHGLFINKMSDEDDEYHDKDFCECIFKIVKEIWK